MTSMGNEIAVAGAVAGGARMRRNAVVAILATVVAMFALMSVAPSAFAVWTSAPTSGSTLTFPDATWDTFGSVPTTARVTFTNRCASSNNTSCAGFSRSITAGGANFAIVTSGPGVTGTQCAASGTVDTRNCAITVQYTPTAVGPQTGTLSIGTSTSGTTPNPIVITLSATGIAATRTLSVRDTANANDLTTRDFGSVAQPDSSVYTFTVKNTGNAAANGITASIPDAAGQYSIVGNTCTTLAAGAACTVTVSFAPTLVGVQSATLQIDSTTLGTDSVALTGTGLVPAPNGEFQTSGGATEPGHNLGSAIVTQPSAPYVYSFKNTGNMTLQGVGNQTITGAHAADFSKTTTCGATLAAGATCTVTVTFTPTATGSRFAQVNVAPTNSGGAVYSSILTGTGTPASPTGEFRDATATTAQPTATLPSTIVTQSSPTSTFTIKNTGNVPLTNIDANLTLGGSNPGDFSRTTTCTATLPVDGSCTVVVTFSPTATGTRSATITAQPGNPGAAPIVMAVNGTGLQDLPGGEFRDASGATATPTATLPATTVSLTSAATTFTIKNTGNVPLTGLNTLPALAGDNPGDFTRTTSCGAVLAVGATCNVVVTFTPTAVGTRSATLTAQPTNPGAAPIAMTVTGTGVAQSPTGEFRDAAGTTATPTATLPSTVVAVTSATSTFTIKNTGNIALTGLNVAPAKGGDNPGDFADATTCTATLAIGATCNVTVTFTPTAAGTRTATLTAQPTNPGAAPIVMTVSGTGIAQALGVQIRNTADSAVKPTQDFGDVAPTVSSSPYVFVVRNTGNYVLSNVLAGQTVTGANPSEFARTSTCGATLAVGATCTVTVTFTPTATGTRSATLTVAPNGVTAATVAMTGNGYGLDVANDVNSGSGQKGWLDTPTVPIGGSDGGEVARMTFDATVPQGEKISEVLVSSSSTTAATAPDASTFNPLPDSGAAGSVQVHTLMGGGTRQLVTSTINMTTLRNNGWAPGLAAGTNVDVCMLKIIVCLSTTTLPSCTNYVGKTSNRYLWVRLRDSKGVLSRPMGTIVRTTDAFGCNFNAAYADGANSAPGSSGGLVSASAAYTAIHNGCNAACRKVAVPAYPYGNRLSSGGSPLAQDASVPVGQPVTVAFKGQGALVDNDANQAGVADASNGLGNLNHVNGVQWRIRNTATGAMFLRTSSGWSACSGACTSGFTAATDNQASGTITNGSDVTWTASPGQSGVERYLTFVPPSRGHWVVEATIKVSANNDATYWNYLGSVFANSPASSGPTLDVTGAPPARPDTGSSYVMHASVADPLDPVNTFDTQGGRVMAAEWDLDNDATNGPGGDGFEDRVVGDPTTGLPGGALDRTFDTAGKAPGTYTVRLRVTDNGAINGADPASAATTFTKQFTVNSLPEPDDQDVHIEADSATPKGITLTASDDDDDPLTYTVAGLQSINGDLTAGGVDGSAASYTWNGTFTGIDTYTFQAHDDHAGVTSGTVRVHVRPNTVISHVAATGTPGTNATQTTSQSFDFVSPQTPIGKYECRLDRNGDTVDDWADCAVGATGTKAYTGLADGSYEFHVRAVNGDDERDGTPATYAWRVDTTAPTTTFVAGSRDDAVVNRQPDHSPLSPVGDTKDTTPQFKLRVDDDSPQDTASYECSFSAGPRAGLWFPCGATVTSGGSAVVDVVDPSSIFWINTPLAQGEYTFSARAVDEVGLHGAAAERTFTVDTIAPDTAVDSSTSGLINATTASFAVSSLDPAATYDCRLVRHTQGGPDTVVFPASPTADLWYHVSGFGDCPGGAAPQFTDLPDGKYTVQLAAVDAAGNADAAPATFDFEVDATAPQTAIDGAVPVAQQARSITFAFHGSDARDDDAWFNPAGSVTRFECRFDSGSEDAWTACQSPEQYGGLADGTHTFDVRSIDQAGNPDPTPAHASFVVDNTAPSSSITASPDTVTNDPTPTIEFGADEATSGYECKVYRPGVDPQTVTWDDCESPYTLPAGDDGAWSVEVRATDLAGNLETTPSTASWVLDTVVPTVALQSHPADPAVASDSRFAFTASDNRSDVRTECSVDGGDFAACTSPATFEGLPDGPHTFAVKAIDAAGNESTEATYDWGIYVNDPDAPVLDTVQPAGAGPWTITTFQAAYAPSDDPAVAIQCSLDGSAWVTCPAEADRPNRFTTSGLADGDHTFRLRAKDPAGNLSSVVQRTWTVDTAAPHTVIEKAPNGLVRSADADVVLSSNEDDVTFACRLDGSGWQDCDDLQPDGATSSAEFSLTGLHDGWHTLAVRATDDAQPAGNVESSPVTRKWKVDTHAPSVAITSSPGDLSPVRDATFGFTSDDPDAAFQCKVGLAAWAPCTSPIEYKNLDEGDQRFLVQAIDAAGNATADPAERAWIIAVPSHEDDPPDDDTPSGPNAVNGQLTTGSITLGTLPDLQLTAKQMTVSGTWDAGTGALALPQSKIKFTTISVDAGSVVPGATAKILLSAAGDGTGTLPAAGGSASVKVPVTAKVEVYAASGAPLLNLGASSNCTIGPIDFDLTGSYDKTSKVGVFSSTAVSVPGAGAGCGPIGSVLGSAIGIPSSTNKVSLTIQFASGAGEDDPPVVDPPKEDPPKQDPPPVTPTPKEGAVKLGATKAAVSTKGKVGVVVTCTSSQQVDTCAAGKVSLKAKVKTKRKKGKKTVTVTRTVTVGSASYAKLTAGKKATVSVTLNKIGKALAKPGKTFKVSTVVQSSAKGAKAVSGTLTLQYPKPKKKKSTKKKGSSKAKRAVPSSTTVPETAEQGEQG